MSPEQKQTLGTEAPKRPSRPRIRGAKTKRSERARNTPFVRSFARKHIETARMPGEKLLRVIPLGGMEEVGRNMTALEYGNDVLIIDMGLQFPEEDMPGIDYIIPNVEYLKGREKDVAGVIITHAHYDHIGAIPHLIPKLGNPPIYGTDLTLAIIKKRHEEFKDISCQLELHEVNKDSRIRIGIFDVEFFGVSHNIPASLGVIVHTPEGIIVHTGDFKVDERSQIAGVTELDKLAKLGQQGGPLLLMSDSTNASQMGKQTSEVDIVTELDDIFKEARGRIIFGTFSSLLGRLNEIIQLGAKYNKKIIIEGRSMKSNIEIAKQLGYITVPKGVIISLEEMKHYPNDQIMIIATGAQGEDRAVLMRIANNEHRVIQIEPRDTFVFSSSVIPGNERTVQRLIDKLYREGVDVINYRMMDIHAGGHAKQEDLQKVIEMTKPKFFMPIEGNHSFLCMHAKIAKKAGMTSDRIIVADNGQIVECKNGVCVKTKEKAPTDYVFVDGLGVGDVGDVVLRDRQMLAQDGMFVVIVTFDRHTRKVRGNADLISRGFVYMRESKELQMEVRRLVRKIVEQSAGNPRAWRAEQSYDGNQQTQRAEQSYDGNHAPGEINWVYIKENIREEVGEFLYKQTHRHPMVIPVVIEV